jgi:hypothetical protein
VEKESEPSLGVLEKKVSNFFPEAVLNFKADNKSGIRPERNKAFFKVRERSWNVYENKGTLWKIGNEAGMS